MKFKTVACVICFVLSVIPFAAAGDEPCVEVFSPQGTVKVVRQVRARFSEQMVPFGDPHVRALQGPLDEGLQEARVYSLQPGLACRIHRAFPFESQRPA